MRYLYYALGIPLLIIGFVLMSEQRASSIGIWGELSKFAFLISGGILLNRALSNKPLLPNGPVARQMLINAREQWLLGAVAIGLFALGFLFVALGANSYFDYGETYPWLTMMGVFALAGSGAYLLWRFLRFVRYGASSVSHKG